MCLSLVLVFAFPSFAQEGTAEPTAEVTNPPPTEEPTAEVTVEPTGEVTAEPTVEPTVEPTGEVTAEPTVVPVTPALPPAPENAILAGLNFPRGVAYDANGNLYVAEAGVGGTELLAKSTVPEFPDLTGGLTSRITVLNADGTQWVPLSGLFSSGSPEGETGGAVAIAFSGSSMWLAFAGTGPVPSPFYANAVVEVDMTTWRILTWIDLYGNELTNNPDGAEMLDANVNDIAVSPDGTLFIMDTGQNTLFTWSAEAGLTPFLVWPDNPVPTSVAFDASGDVYVGFLGGGLAPGAGKVEHWSADGSELLETYGGLNTITDIAFGADGLLYAVSLIQFGEQGPQPGSGSILQVGADGATVVAEGLSQPYSLAQAPDGSWSVSINTVFAPPGSGAVLTIGGGM
jgi:sugar lactone lactonase YvrE